MAKTTIHSDYIPDNAITSTKIAENSIGAREIATNAITTLYVADGSVSSEKLASNIDIAGTFDVTGATTLDAGLTVDTDTLVVDATNNRVGIGTSSPSAPIDIKSTNSTSIKWQRTGVSAKEWGFVSDNDQTYLYNFTDGVVSTSFANNGNVGIGTTSPSYPLEVQSGGVGTVLRAGTSFISIDPTGSASAPSLIFNGDANTGIWRPAADTLAVSTAGSEKMRIDSSGALGLGTTPPTTNVHPQFFIGTESVILGSASGALDIGNNLYYNSGWKHRTTGAASLLDFDASGNFVFYNVASAAADSAATLSESMRINSSGNVGIGGTASDGNLHVRKTGVNTGITNVLMNAGFADGSNGTGLSIGYRTDETTAVLAPRTATGNLAFYNYDGGWSESMRITNSGNVGIGTSSPATKLDVNGAIRLTDSTYSIYSSGAAAVIGHIGNTANDLNIYSSTSGHNGLRFHVNGILPTDNSGTIIDADADLGDPSYRFKNLYLSGYASVNALASPDGTSIVFPDNSGNVGIGTSSPTQGKVDILDAGDYDAHTGHGLTINSNANNAYTSMYMGADDSIDAAYIQSAGRNTSFTSKKLLLNPNGGNVGIGTTSPTVPLQINHGSSSVGLYTSGPYNYQAKFESSDAEAAIVIEDSNSTNDGNRIGVITDDMTFITAGSERMRINSSEIGRAHV